MSSETNINTNISVEYQALRAEIRYLDRLCVTLLVSLFTISGTFYSYLLYNVETKGLYLFFLLPILSFIWIVGFLYITDKRFVILKIAKYLREEVENEQINLYWEKWLSNNRKQQNIKYNRIQFPNTNPYLIETISCIVILFLNFALTGYAILYKFIKFFSFLSEKICFNDSLDVNCIFNHLLYFTLFYICALIILSFLVYMVFKSIPYLEEYKKNLILE